MKALTKAFEACGGISALANKLGVAHSAPSMWKSRGSVPAQHCLAIERATDGVVTRQELRPDDFWRIWPDLAHLAPKAAA